MVHPRHFISEYVDPAIELYRTNRTVKHLAVHAMTQVDLLAAVVALWKAKQPTLKRGQERKFREQLGAREPVLALIQDAHDCHKHGGLTRTTAVAASQGQRPEQKTKFGFFLETLAGLMHPRVSVRGSVRSSSRRCCETSGKVGQRRLPKCGNINPRHT
jgi:hypothetical protein